jgi:hypothetical protein
MSSKLKSSILGLAAGLFFFSASAGAVTAVDRSVPGNNLWDYVYFHHSGGALTIDIWSDNWTGGPTGVGIYDSWIAVLADDGSLPGALTGEFIGFNDDAGTDFPTVGAADGSTFSLDSFLDLGTLGAGDYILAVGACCHVEAEVRSNADSNITQSDFDYRATFSQNVDVGGVDVVPLPAALPLFATGLGAMGLLGWRRKRKAQAAA